MNVITTDLPGVLIIEPKVFGDERGFFYESFNEREFAEKTGVNRQALYTALSENGNPTLETLLKVMSALGIRLKCEAVEQAKAA